MRMFCQLHATPQSNRQQHDRSEREWERGWERGEGVLATPSCKKEDDDAADDDANGNGFVLRPETERYYRTNGQAAKNKTKYHKK